VAEGGHLLLGLDAGNTVIKAVLFDREGRQLALCARDGASQLPRPGHVERDPEELWRLACEAIRGCLAEAAVDPAAIAAIGCAGHGNGLYLVDGDGNALVGIQSLDTRAATLAGQIAERNGDALHAACLQKPWPAQTAVLLAWIAQHRPDVYRLAATTFLCKDFLTFRLTGERVSDISDMSGAGLLLMPDARVDADLMALYALPGAEAKMPRLAQPSEIVGRVTKAAAAATGLAEGTPLVAGLFDVVASALGSGVVEPGQASIIAGTWSINQVLSDTALHDPAVFMVSAFGPRRFASIEASATSAANLEWYVRTFVERDGHDGDPFANCNAVVAAVTPAADDPIFHPYLYGSGRSAAARGGFYGFAGWHGEGHVLRALFEGVVFEHRQHIERLTASGIPFTGAVMSGGGTRSPIWPQMMADCLGVPIKVAECRETGALGAAIAAGVGAGMFADFEEGVAAMTRVRSVFHPDPILKAHYDRRYRVFRELAQVMGPFWATLQNEGARG
jgi:L-xylulokinase